MDKDVFVIGSMVTTYGLWIVLPLLPAILIYKLFPDTKVSAKGVLSGLTVRATGAFAGYLIVLLVGLPIVLKVFGALGAMQRPVWTLSARVALRDAAGAPVPLSALERSLDVRFSPELHSIQGDQVKLKIPGNLREWPQIFFQISDFGGRALDLSQALKEQVLEMDEYDKIAILHTPVVIDQLEPSGIGVITGKGSP
jgi:hypothetical protein